MFVLLTLVVEKEDSLKYLHPVLFYLIKKRSVELFVFLTQTTALTGTKTKTDTY